LKPFLKWVSSDACGRMDTKT